MTRHSNALGRTHTKAARSALALACAVFSVAAATTVLMDASPAYARDWMEVSCENPNQSAAPNQGWTSFFAAGGNGSNNDTVCGPGSPMSAILSTNAGVAVGSNETLQYTPPSGSTLTGGQVDVSLYADGYGADASGTAIVYSPEFAYNGSNVVLQCATGQPPCSNGTNDFGGVLDLPTGRGGSVFVSAACGGEGGQYCDEGGSNGAWSLVQLWWANLLLSNNATPRQAVSVARCLARALVALRNSLSSPPTPEAPASTPSRLRSTAKRSTPAHPTPTAAPVCQSAPAAAR